MIQAVVICDGAEPCPEGFLPHHVPYRPQASTNLNGKTSQILELYANDLKDQDRANKSK
jgi:hypothetical protein